MESRTTSRLVLNVLVLILEIVTLSSAVEQKAIKVEIESDSKLVIGGLFPVHSKGHSADDRCGPMLLDKGMQRLEAMLYAIDQINRNESYWQFKLGVTAFDTCSSDSYALEQSLQFLHYSCGSDASIKKKVAAVVGAANSEVSATVANFLRLFQIPQVSYASTSKELDDLIKYPYFYRVVPSDRFQVKVILDILTEFQWTYVSAVASQGDYGESAVKHLQHLVQNSTRGNEICFATVEILPRVAKDEDYNYVVRRLDLHDKAKVVIVFLNEDKISALLDACERCDMPRNRFIWLGSDGWGAKERVVNGREELTDGSITILPKRFPVQAGFDSYFKSLNPWSNLRNPWFKEFWENQFDCVFRNSGGTASKRRKRCTGNEDLSEKYKQEGLVPMVIDSVYLLATAIKQLCTKNPNFCRDPERTETKYRNSLIDVIGNTSLKSSQGHDMQISFDETRSVPVNYTVFQFRKISRSEDRYGYRRIGEWNPFTRLRLIEQPIWKRGGKTDDEGRPISSCGEECGSGEERVFSSEFRRRCCWACRPCNDTSYLYEPHRTCKQCSQGEVPSKDKMSCVETQILYIGLHLGNPWALVPLVFSVLGLISTSVVFVIFFMYHKTPIIMASGRELCYVILIGIVLCYCYPFVVLLRPTEVSCGALRIGMGLGLSICYSAIFTKTNRLSRIFEVSMKITKRPSYISPESQVLICVCLVLIQLTLTVMWLIVEPPSVSNKYIPINRIWVMVCNLDGISVTLGLLYNMILLILCTIYAYKTRNIPENFNETKWISFTMYSSCIIWMAFIAIYSSATFAVQDYKVQSTILSMCVSTSGTVTLVCIFLPKIYIVLFHPERNVRYPNSSATSGTGTCDSGTPVRYLRTVPNSLGVQQPSPVNRPDSPFLLVQNHKSLI